MRLLESRDRGACLALLDGNTPEFFDPSERPAFEAFLASLARPGTGPYFVLEDGGAVVACGGLALDGDPSAGVATDATSVGLTWGIVRRDRHGRGLGTALVRARLAWLARHAPDARAVLLETTPKTAGFYARLGFETTRVRPDGFAPGLDAVEMRLDLPGRRRA